MQFLAWACRYSDERFIISLLAWNVPRICTDDLTYYFYLWIPVSSWNGVFCVTDSLSHTPYAYVIHYDWPGRQGEAKLGKVPAMWELTIVLST
ncbi:hypothetical protein DPMN_178409 [Dreissena polymorpha]|uniref:Uncharacterized protein n=1 Tax=Dreissena polymorpha TaxID=45954 RepID=A0A9D4IJV0_DREPO|nr:hypothetical protein DPMN_178409 [Dreissena polymorpha]